MLYCNQRDICIFCLPIEMELVSCRRNTVSQVGFVDCPGYAITNEVIWIPVFTRIAVGVRTQLKELLRARHDLVNEISHGPYGLFVRYVSPGKDADKIVNA